MSLEVAAVSLHIPTQAAGTDDEWYIAWPYAGKWVLEAVDFAPATAVAIDGTDYFTITGSVNDGAGSSPATAFSHNTNTGGTALVIGTTIQPTVTPRELRRGYQIKVAKVKTASGKVFDGTYTFRARKEN